MKMQIERDFSSSHEFNPEELVVDSHDIYKRSLEIIRLEPAEEKDQEDLARLEELRRIKGYVGGYELNYRIEGFDFIKLSDEGGIQLLTLLSPLTDEQKVSSGLFAPRQAYEIFKHQLENGKKEKLELKIHEFDDSGDEFLTGDYYYTLYPIVVPIWEPYKVKKVEEALEVSSERELIDLS
jgi:hypothetical protein